MPANKEFQYKVTLHGFDKLTRTFRSAPQWLGEEMSKGMRQSGLAVQRESAILAPVDTGRLRASIETQIDGNVIPEWVKIGPTVKYGAFVEFGRKPGARMPPPSALIPWIRRHGGAGNPEAAAFLLARAIAKRGIKPRPYMQDGFKGAQRAISRIWDRVGRSLEMRWGRENG